MSGFTVLNANDAALDSLVTPFSSIGADWMLITAGNGLAREAWNTMTASWGAFGVHWGKRTITCMVRPTRHTFAFIEREPLVTFSFFGPEARKALEICGSTSGVDTDKASAAGLSPQLLEPGAIGFSEARVTFVCKKIYAQDLDPALFIDPAIEKNYPKKDYHRVYVCEILRAYQGDRSK